MRVGGLRSPVTAHPRHDLTPSATLGGAVTPADIAVIQRRLDEQDETLGEILSHVKQTNGRVLKLEIWQARVIGAVAVLTVAAPLGLAILLH
jgi:tetrahydromethanopterin S-methyltransferase subunit G